MTSDTSDFRDVQESADAAQESAGGGRKLGPAGKKSMRGEGDAGAGSAEEVNTDTPTKFGTFAHQGYGIAAGEKYGEKANIERRVGVTRADGTLAEGEVDLTVGNALIDYKTDDMRDWTTSEARAAAHKHGQQMKEYVDSPDTPIEAKGWIIATVPPRSQEVRSAYAGGLKECGVGAKFAKGEDQTSVMQAVDQAVKET
jgi:hypothetical protein